MANTKLYATGSQLSKSINNKFYPTNYTVPMLGFGDFLKNNAGTIGSLVGGAAGLFLGNPMLGAEIGGSVGGAFEGETKSQKDAALKAQMEAQQKQVMLQQLNDGTLMAAKGGLLPSYAGGGGLTDGGNLESFPDVEFGNLHPFGHLISFYKSNPSVEKIPFKSGVKTFPVLDAGSGLLQIFNEEKKIRNSDNPKMKRDQIEYDNAMKRHIKLKGSYPKGMRPEFLANGGNLDNVTLYAEGGSHETNPNGGIPIGNKALVEQGEVRYNSKKYGDYIFSDRF